LPGGGLIVAPHSSFSYSLNSAPLLIMHPTAIPNTEYSVALFCLSLSFFAVWLVWCDEGIVRMIREVLFFRPFFRKNFDFFNALTWVVFGDSFMQIIREHVTFDFGQDRLRCFSSTTVRRNIAIVMNCAAALVTTHNASSFVDARFKRFKTSSRDFYS
jgi:hypothetical protein